MTGLRAFKKQVYGRAYVVLGWRLDCALGRLVVEGALRDLPSRNIAGDFDHHGPRSSVPKGVKRTAHRGRDLGGIVNHLSVTGDGGVRPSGGEVRPDGVLVQRGAAREVQYGNIVAEGLGDPSHGVLGAGSSLRDDDAELLPVVQPAEAVGRHDGAALLPEHERANALLGYRLDQLVGWEAGHPLHLFRLQNAGNCAVDVHV